MSTDTVRLPLGPSLDSSSSLATIPLMACNALAIKDDLKGPGVIGAKDPVKETESRVDRSLVNPGVAFARILRSRRASSGTGRASLSIQDRKCPYQKLRATRLAVERRVGRKG